jgi:hypothetical protein
MTDMTEFGIALPKNKINRALTIAGNWTGEFVAIVTMIPFAGGIIAALTKYFVYFFSVIGIFAFGIVGSILGGLAGGIWYGILVGLKLAKRMFYSVTGKPENPDNNLFMNPFKRKGKLEESSLER